MIFLDCLVRMMIVNDKKKVNSKNVKISIILMRWDISIKISLVKVLTNIINK